MSYYLQGLSGDEDVLSHSLVPYTAKPVYLRLTNTRAEATHYAACGFHVSVTRGLAGGCKDERLSVQCDRDAACKQPLGRQDLREAWANAAEGYLDAYKAATSGVPVAEVVSMLHHANSLASVAGRLEGVPLLVDPGTGAAEGAITKPAGIGGLSMPAMAGLGLGAFLLFGGLKTKKGGGKKRRRQNKHVKARKLSKRRARRLPKRRRVRRLRRRR